MDINKVYLSGVISNIYSLCNFTESVNSSFELRAESIVGNKRLCIEHYQIYFSDFYVKKKLSKSLSIGQRVKVQGSIKKAIYTDSLGKRVTVFKIVAHLITPI